LQAARAALSVLPPGKAVRYAYATLLRSQTNTAIHAEKYCLAVSLAHVQKTAQIGQEMLLAICRSLDLRKI